MPDPASRKPPRHLRASDLRAAAQLATQATAGVTRIVEGVHQSVLGTLGARGSDAPGRTTGITGLVYRSVLGATRLLGQGADLALARLQPLLETLEGTPADSPQREAALAVLNGVMGDRLAESGSALATRMTLRLGGVVLDPARPPAELIGCRRLVLLVHGLCMNDLQWRGDGPQAEFDHGELLANTLGARSIYLRYNSGRHVSDNGAELAALLERLLGSQALAVDALTVVGHSMGGLVLRSALHQARQQGLRWPALLRHMVFLGTPHHGAPLERAGNWVDVLLGSTPWSAPLARLGQLRSAGITDLRYGFVLRDDWHGHERFRRRPDRRHHVALPEGVACHAVAATLAGQRSALADRLVGDGLVPLRSALGQHDDPQRTLVFASNSQVVVWRTGHIGLLRSPEVAAQLVRWLA